MIESPRIPPVPPRLTDRPFPPYSYVPGKFPHPVRDSLGHMYGDTKREPPIDGHDAAAICVAHHWAIDLFNYGYYWEAHEAWEALWHAFGRVNARANFVKGLIKLAATGVKAREGNANGVQRHARRAVELFRDAAEDANIDWQTEFGLEPRLLVVKSERLGEMVSNACDSSRVHSGDIVRVMPFILVPC